MPRQEKERLAALSEEVQRVSRYNAALLDELNKVKSSQPLTGPTRTVDVPEESAAPKATTVPRREGREVRVGDCRVVLTIQTALHRFFVLVTEGGRTGADICVDLLVHLVGI